ncbi:MAG: glutamate--tRNA ligase [Pyrinomonadaceae bacterium]
MSIRVRFAPSPTGYLHLGAARAALFNYLYARQKGGKFLLRIEDTDLERSTDESTRSILDGLKWLELEYDEQIVFQSENADKHRAAALKLLNEGKAYRDFTPKAERAEGNIKDAIAEKARASQGEKNMRDNPFRDLSREESEGRAEAGEPFAIRLKVGERGTTSFDDAVFGLQERDYSEIEDLVLLRSDGHPLYNLAVVCDDIEMQITDVIRGQDHLTNTHKQILIYDALVATKPRFAHLPLILAPGGKKLSKRIHGEIVSLTTYRDAGFIAAAFRNFLALMGWSPKTEQEIMNLPELIAAFSLENINRSSAIFNFDANNPKRWTDDKALWMNAEYIRTMPLEELLPLVKAELKSAKLWREEYEDDDQAWFEKTVDLIRSRFFTLKDFSSQGRAFFSEDFDFDETALKKNLWKEPQLKMWMPELADKLETVEQFDHDEVQQAVSEFAEANGVKVGLIANAARAMITGQAVGASMFEIMSHLGKERVTKRLRSQIPFSFAG